MRPLSHSSINMYKTCPLMYKLKYITHLPEVPKPYFSFGSVLHEAAEFFYKGQSGPPTLQALLGFYDAHWISEGYGTKEDEEAQRALGRQILTTFWELRTKDYEPPVATEYQFNTSLRGVPVTGYVDLVRRLPDGTLEVLDYKSGKSAHDVAQVRESEQLLMYQVAVSEAFGKDVGRLTIYHLRSNTAVSVGPHTKEEAERLLDSIEEVARGIEGGRFEPVENPYCPCDWSEHCPFYKEAYKDRTAGQTTLDDHGPSVCAVDIEAVVADYLQLKDRAGADEERLGMLDEAIRSYCAEKGVKRVFSGDRQVTLFHAERTGYDKDAVRKALEGTPYLPKAMDVVPAKVDEILGDKSLDPRLRRALLAARASTGYDYLRVAKRKP